MGYDQTVAPSLSPLIRPMQLIPTTLAHLDDLESIEQSTQFSPWPRAEFERSLNSNQRMAWTALAAERVIGFAVYNIIGSEAELLTISIAPDCQGRGLGRQLLQQTLAHLECDSVFLEVRESNTSARGLYESLGFNEIGHRARYYPAANGREDAVIYALDLKLQALIEPFFADL